MASSVSWQQSSSTGAEPAMRLHVHLHRSHAGKDEEILGVQFQPGPSGEWVGLGLLSGVQGGCM